MTDKRAWCQPRNETQAAELLERFAVLEGHLAHIQGVRDTLIAQANKNADASASPVLKEMIEIHDKLGPWWAKAAPALTKGKRKSIELGGCLIGTKAGRDTLGTAEDLDPVVAWLEKRAWAKPLLRFTVSIDKAAVLKSIDGVYKKQLAALGFRRVAGVEQFYVKRAEQCGTLAGEAS